MHRSGHKQGTYTAQTRQKKETVVSSTRQDLVKRLNQALTELHLLWREEHSKSMDVFLRQKIEEYASEEMLGKLLSDVEYEIHQRKKR